MKPVKPRLANLITAVNRQIDGMNIDMFIAYVCTVYAYMYVPVNIPSISLSQDGVCYISRGWGSFGKECLHTMLRT